VDVLYQTKGGTGSYQVSGGSGGLGTSTGAGSNGSDGKVDFQQAVDITASLTGSGELLLTGDTTVTSLGVTYDPASETYTFTANSGVAFGADDTVPGTVIFTPNGNTATLAPNGTTWAALGYTVGTETTNLGGTAITLGGPGAPASNFGTAFDVANSSGGTTGLTVDDSADSASQTIGVTSSSLSFTGGPTFTYGGAYLIGLGLEAGAADGNAITVTGSPVRAGDFFRINDSATSDHPDTITIGDAAHPASGLIGDVTVSGPGATSLTIDDSGSTASGAYSLQAGQFAIGAAPVLPLNNLTGLTGLTIKGSSGGDTWDVAGTPAGVATTIATDPAGGDSDLVTLGGANGNGWQVGSVAVDGGGAGNTILSIDDSGDTSSRAPMLEYDSTSGLSDLTGLSASTFAFNAGVADVNLFPSSSAGVTTTLTVDFSQGNPLPSGGTSIFTFLGLLGASNALILQGELPGSTPFDSEAYTPTANEAGAGAITLTAGSATSTLDFGGLAPITDTVPAIRYTFTAPSNAQIVNVTNGPSVGAFATDTISSGDTSSAFELVNFANKNDVLIDLTAIVDPTYVPPPSTPATGLNDLTIAYFGPSTTGHTLDVDGTTPGATDTIVVGGSGNTVVVQGVTAGGPLVIDNEPAGQGGADSVTIGDSGSLANIAAGVTIDGSPQSTVLTVDGSAATTPFGDMLLELTPDGSMAELTGLLPGGALAYDPVAITGNLDLSTGSGSDSLSIDFANGDPFLGLGADSPDPSPYTLQFNAGGGGDSLTFQDSAETDGPIFDSEDYIATGPNSGTVSFYDGPAETYQGGVDFTDLTPTTDSTPVTNYTFTPPSTVGTIAVTDGPTAGSALISDPSPSPTFESVAYSNKTNVTIDATAVTRNNA
jgi:hypothetical protein